MNFEAKLNSDLPRIRAFENMWPHLGGIGTKIYGQSRFGGLKVLSSERSTKYIFDLDGIRLNHRYGGPSYYKIRDGRPYNFEWWYAGQQYSCMDYYNLLFDSLALSFTFIEKGDSGTKVVVDRKGSKLPLPYSINQRTGRIVWKLAGRIVSLQRFWTIQEQRFIHGDYRGRMAWMNNQLPRVENIILH